LGEPGLTIVDVRETAAYNGWKLEGEARGGHIYGAVDFPLSWTEHVADTDFRALLKAKGITPDKAIVVYGAQGDKSAVMAQLLRELGYERVLTYDTGLAAWAADETLPMTHLANYERLVHPKWVYELIRGQHPAIYPGRGSVLFEVGSGEPEAYDRGHIPGAVYLDTNTLEGEPFWNRVSDRDLEATLIAHGVTCDATIVLYGRDTAAAARVASIMMYAGVEDVRLLDGGFEAWTSAGYEVETVAHRPAAVGAFGTEIPAHPEYMIDTEGARAILADDEAELVSVRSWAEYIGEASGYSYIEPKGRIAGAVWGHAGSAPHSMEYYRNPDNTMRNYHEIAANWREWGITPDKRIVFYCGTGWRASEAFFYAYLMGWINISVYDGGWHEWSSDPSSPIESGDPRKNPPLDTT
jgi:thiosulfate/3-mercaptopyruvate sulfurtransferase